MNRIRVYPKKWLWRIYLTVSLLSLLLDVIWRYTHRLSYHFQFQSIYEFFALFGLIGCMILILIARGLGAILVVHEDYYQHRNREEF
ncbi:MAG: hypothetical protein AB1659_04040 [Thermodesulfobacteriota bacterium]